MTSDTAVLSWECFVMMASCSCCLKKKKKKVTHHTQCCQVESMHDHTTVAPSESGLV